MPTPMHSGSTPATIPIAAKALVLGLIVLTFVGAGVSFQHRVARGKSDFLGLYRQAELVRTTGSFVNEHSGPYPPSARAAYQLWVSLPPSVAAAIWFVLASALYLGTAWWLVRSASGLPTRDHMPAMCVALVIAAPWIASDLAQGNISSLLMFAVVGGGLLAQRGNPWAAGLVLSLGIIMKPVALVGLFYLLLKRHWRASLATAIFALVLGFVPPVLLVGWDRALEGWLSWYRTVGWTHSPLVSPWISVPQIDYENGSAIASLMRLFRDVRAGDDWSITLVVLPTWGLALLWYALAAVLTLPVLWLTRHPARKVPIERQAVELAAYLVLMLWFSPLLMSYYLGITLVPVSVLIWHLVRVGNSGRRDWATIGLLVAFGVSAIHMASPTLRAAGATPATLLILWVALVRLLWVMGHKQAESAAEIRLNDR